MNKFISIIVLTFASTVAFAIDCTALVPYGYPVISKPTESTQVLCRRMYVLEHSPTRKTAYWSAENIFGPNVMIEGKRNDAFKADPDVKSGDRAELEDYYKSEYDRGHLAPVGNMKVNNQAMVESFYLSNVVPHVPGNNRAIWNALEGYAREIAIARSHVYVISGPIYEGPVRTIGTNKVAVPTKLYKIFVDTRSQTVLVFIIPNVPYYATDLPRFISTMSEVEKRTGIKFFPELKTKLTESTTLWGKTSN